MPELWREHMNPDPILSRLNRAVRLGEGTVKVEDLTFLAEMAVLVRMLNIKDLALEDLSALVSTAVYSVALENRGQIARNTLEAALAKYIDTFRRRPEKKFAMVTSISVSPGSLRARRRVGGCTLLCDADTSRFPVKDETLLPKISPYASQVRVPHYAGVVVHVSARSLHEAFARSEERLCELRGIWNWLINFRRRTHYFGTLPNPINQVRLGPVHTLHEPDGALIPDRFWIDRHCETSLTPFDFSTDKGKKVLEGEKRFRRKLARHAHRDFIWQCMRRYAQILDSAAFERAYAELWGLLETLTLTHRAHYDTTVRRAGFSWRDQTYARAELEHLRECRNDMVHAGTPQHDSYDLVCRLRKYCEQLLLLWMVEFGQYPTDEVKLRLDAPRTEAALKRNIRISKAILGRR